MSSNLKTVLTHRQYFFNFYGVCSHQSTCKKKKKKIPEQNDGQTLDVTLPVYSCLVCYK